jgi:hypothetical protein
MTVASMIIGSALLVVYVVLTVSGLNQHHAASHGLSLPAGRTIALALILVNYAGAVRAALGRSGRQ